MSDRVRSSVRPGFDSVIQTITDYVLGFSDYSELAMETAYHCLIDSLACGFLALKYPACTKLLGPAIPGMSFEPGIRVPGTDHKLDPMGAAWNIGALVRWLDFNDTWLAAEWGHPSDNLGAILSCAQYAEHLTGKSLTVEKVLQAMIKAHEIQGILALDNSFNRVGLDHVLLVRIASTAVSCWLLGADRDQTLNAVSHAWIDGSALRTYRHAPNTGSRKSWAAGDASARGVFLAITAMKGEMGYPSAITAKDWGFQDVSFGGKEITLAKPLDNYVMENILFKISFPAEFHAQTAVEAGCLLHEQVKDRLDEIERIEMQTQEPGVRIIDKTGPLDNPADRDHCLQYMAAIALLKGNLVAEDYEDDVANDPRVDALRDKMTVSENPRFTEEYYDLDKRAIGNSIQVFFKDGSSTDLVSIDYPVGHRVRREEGIPLLKAKFKAACERGGFSSYLTLLDENFEHPIGVLSA